MTSPSLAATPVRERTRVVTPVPPAIARAEPAFRPAAPPGAGSLRGTPVDDELINGDPTGGHLPDDDRPDRDAPDDGAPHDDAPHGDSTRGDPTRPGGGEARLLPDPRPLAETLARCVVEVLAGTRDIDQIARWLSTDVHAHLMKRVVLARRARTLRGESPGRFSFTLGSTVLCEPSEGVVEAVVIVHGRARSRAVALRLEALGARWRASAVHVL
ncbi:Rv3235 family protein [Herbiconiux sp. CPCC 205716]|uniref:Rv3235 family protein n=1 Tax=Herbiconiux gentiana TaxID=2970912 RepID=A0ABT2GL69_9MICO|nr:Rv3235 family protein [Herbiconiux gentiana]MCS5716342.1 Rv3235 family protein [Herbiconiux gentiana]